LTPLSKSWLAIWIWSSSPVRYRYPNGAIVVSMCRQMDKTEPLVAERVGAKGRASAGRIVGTNPYEQEHADLIQSIREGRPLNEGRTVAEATLTAIMGRMSAYTGQPVSWKFALEESELDLTPGMFKKGEFKLGPAPAATVAMPGVTELI
jgi:hypothetical protein